MSCWIGVDLDGTLAHYESWGDGSIGKPIAPMVERVKRWLSEGKTVKIFTARVSCKDVDEAAEQVRRISEWCEEHLGRVLPITNAKDFGMYELWDDRAIQVIRNAGHRVGLWNPEQ